MEVQWHPVNVCLIGFAFAFINLVVAQDESGFISIDCGIPESFSYTDVTTGISYTSDAGFIDGGESHTIQAAYKTNSLDRRLVNLRSFPQGTRNCYILEPSLGKGYKYLIRASFLYGNYDLKNKPPSFDVYLGVNLWGRNSFKDLSTPIVLEVLHVLSSDYIEFCLVNTNQGIPFVSSLEVRPFNSSLYVTQSGSLQLLSRYNLGPTDLMQLIRYKDDIYDRIWTVPETKQVVKMLSTSSDIPYGMFQVPSIVMRTAIGQQGIFQRLEMTWEQINDGDQFYFYVHFAEVESMPANQPRKFNVYINGELKNPDASSPIVLSYLETTSAYSTAPLTVAKDYTMTINRSADSPQYPIINAYEIYVVKQFNNLQTDDGDAAAMWSIKKIYGVVNRNWQGDPCRPAAFEWDGVNCSNDSTSLPRIIALNLSGSGLTGELASIISNLTAIQILDLSYNHLSGQIPESLAQLSSLSVLNLKGNNFTGPVPAQLFQKRDKGLLSLSIDNSTPPRMPKKKSIVIPVVALVIPASIVLFALLAYLWMTRMKNQIGTPSKSKFREKENSGNQSLHHNVDIRYIETKNRQLTSLDIKSIITNFEQPIGKGGFGSVYHGCIDKTPVIVEIFSKSSERGDEEFQAEVKILLNVIHKNVTRLVGYCHEGEHMGLIYEFMAKGNLKQHLSEEESRVLDWKERLQIAIHAAEGLAYLHHGCTPSIIHRDVTSINILLNENFEAKLAYFGRSRVETIKGNTHVSTMVSGTPGYIDPEYVTSGKLTEKSDVYSFGVVLMEVISGQPAVIGNGQEKTSIVKWFSSKVENVNVIADSRLRGNFNTSSFRQAVELATACTDQNPGKRPMMTDTVSQLKSCLEKETTYIVSIPSEIEISLDSNTRQFTYSDIKRITTDFTKPIGEGGFGSVYRGCMDGTQVAVKILSQSSDQGFKEFQNEIKILLNVNHKNVTRLIGYCYEGKHLGLIYEFMAKGNLKQHLSGEESHIMDWKERLQIIIDAAEGLKYLHHDCKPSIIHRDVKSANILLNENFEAKLGDFGLSKIVLREGASYVETKAAGTLGYADPEYVETERLTEKSDVYSFGVVLMEVITGWPVTVDGQKNTYIVERFSSKVQTANVEKMADPRLKGKFNVISFRQAANLAMTCTENPEKRPTMTETLTELKGCLEMEIASAKTDSEYAPLLPAK